VLYSLFPQSVLSSTNQNKYFYYLVFVLTALFWSYSCSAVSLITEPLQDNLGTAFLWMPFTSPDQQVKALKETQQPKTKQNKTQTTFKTTRAT